ncbi:MAG: amidohydrolase [Clostridium sp.]|uniref:M20 metallopeptidase family protein n=2 Tax=Clostridium sp. TaxID=1506 RepID=UPI002FC62F99
MIYKEIENIAANIEDEIISIRRHLHMNPELSFKEFNTSKFILNKLTEHGIEGAKIIGDTGVVVLIEGGSKEIDYKTVLLRGDIDALPIREETNLEFASCNEYMHACGHDAHISWTIGTAIVLNRIKDSLKGDVKVVFQMAEEVGGASKIIEEGILENPAVNIAVAGHCWPSLEVGVIGIAKGVAMASTGGFKLEIKGRGGHGAEPHNCIDPIAIGIDIYNSIQKIVSRRVDIKDPIVISICSINSGSCSNIIPDTCTINGTVRALSYEKLEEVNSIINEISKATCDIYGGECNIKFSMGLHPVINDKSLINSAVDSFSKHINKDNIKLIDHPAMTGEDFSEFTRRIPGLFIYIGSTNEENGINHKLHSCKFDIDENVLKVAIVTFSRFIYDYISE